MDLDENQLSREKAGPLERLKKRLRGLKDGEMLPATDQDELIHEVKSLLEYTQDIRIRRRT